tara:strand:+ start:914 stop:1189 length:276 start_codon:yes stop_codon:yes gene_type:complete
MAFEKRLGSRAEVFHGKARQTTGGLRKKDLMKNKRGEIVSKKKHSTAKKEKRLEKHGYFAEKGKFGYVKKTPKASKKSKTMKKRRTGKKKN